MPEKQHETTEKVTEAAIQVTMTIDMGQAEQILRDLARAYGWDGLRDLITHMQEEASDK
jgi:hypothetical protein